MRLIYSFSLAYLIYLFRVRLMYAFKKEKKKKSMHLRNLIWKSESW